MALERICGLRGDQLGEDVAALWETMGQYAQRISTISVGGYGKRFLDAKDPDSRSWAAWVEAELSLVRSLEHNLAQVLTADQIRRSQAAVEKLYDFRFSPVLCHANIGGTNAIVESTGDNKAIR